MTMILFSFFSSSSLDWSQKTKRPATWAHYRHLDIRNISYDASSFERHHHYLCKYRQNRLHTNVSFVMIGNKLYDGGQLNRWSQPKLKGKRDSWASSKKNKPFYRPATIHYKHILRPDNGNNFYCVSFRWVVKTKLSWEYDIWNELEGRQASKYNRKKKQNY